ncbi:hypothetical protein RIF29_40788 [Crotalaria pallida]|uniref:Uncharacterized protein n=1 Tax=Crotalaria pallida TaxID=3830 RepID=A0AAN9E457_CROPI
MTLLEESSLTHDLRSIHLANGRKCTLVLYSIRVVFYIFQLPMNQVLLTTIQLLLAINLFLLSHVANVAE